MNMRGKYKMPLKKVTELKHCNGLTNFEGSKLANSTFGVKGNRPSKRKMQGNGR